ncbi:MAG: methyltransferase domain-containing protein [Pseudomonadales bacterium]|nr:methyltransferase domain-containing protein [Pseudomonadales bacterium]
MTQRLFDEFNVYHSENGIGHFSGTGEVMAKLLQDFEPDKKTLQGPTLSLYAGEVGAERLFVTILQIRNKKILAVDHNPHLVSKDEMTDYLLGSVTDVIGKIEANSIGIITIFGSDGSVNNDDWKIIWQEAHRVLKPNGHLVIFPTDNILTVPRGFSVLIQGTNFLIVKKL